MILSDRTIKYRLAKDLIITADGKRITDGVSIQPASFDLRLGSDFASLLKNCSEYTERTDVFDPKFPGKVFYNTVQEFVIKPRQFILATTKEYICLPDDLTAFVEGRSSIGRMGLFVQNAGWVDPGFHGEITLELFNAGSQSIKLYSGMRIAQLVFAQLDCIAENPYNGKYQGQTGATPSMVSKDEDLQKLE